MGLKILCRLILPRCAGQVFPEETGGPPPYGAQSVAILVIP